MINSDFFVSQKWGLDYVGRPGETPFSKEVWVQFIEGRKDFSWSEELAAYAPKTAALADFDKKKGFHKFKVLYAGQGFKIIAIFNEMRPNRIRLLQCLELAEVMGAHLFRISAKKPVSREWIDKNYPEKKKAE